MVCKMCGSDRLATRPNPKNPNATDLFCTECGTWQKFANANERRMYPAKAPVTISYEYATCTRHMTPFEYQEQAMTTAGEYATNYDMIRNAAYGMNGEAGEVIDILKKHEFQGHSLDRDAILDETGDVLWYVALMATALGVPLEDIMRHNIEKLAKRYPEGFDPERSIHRAEYEEANHENH